MQFVSRNGFGVARCWLVGGAAQGDVITKAKKSEDPEESEAGQAQEKPLGAVRLCFR